MRYLLLGYLILSPPAAIVVVHAAAVGVFLALGPSISRHCCCFIAAQLLLVVDVVVAVVCSPKIALLIKKYIFIFS